MPQSRRMFRLSPGRIWVRRSRVHIPPSASTTANKPPQTAAPVNAAFRARWSGGATREGSRMRADVRAGRDVPRDLLLSLNRETLDADSACGTVRL